MYVIRKKDSKATIHIDSQPAHCLVSGSTIYPEFDEENMELGWTDKNYIPAYYDIDAEGRLKEIPIEEAASRSWHQLAPTQELVDGKIVTKDEDRLIKEGLLDLAALKAQLAENVSRAAFEQRARLIPDYKLQNAALGVYADDRPEKYRATIAAFRDEVHRIEEAILRAKTAKELRSIRPNFPEAIVDSATPPTEKKLARKKQ